MPIATHSGLRLSFTIDDTVSVAAQTRRLLGFPENSKKKKKKNLGGLACSPLSLTRGLDTFAVMKCKQFMQQNICLPHSWSDLAALHRQPELLFPYLL